MTEEANPAQQPKPSVLAMIGGGVGAIIGLGVGRYAGIFLLIPVVFAAATGWILSRIAPSQNKPVFPASAVLAGHGLWMLLGAILLMQFDPVLIDFLVLLAGAAWLAFQPSIVAVGILVCFQAFAIFVNGIAFAAATPNTEPHKALLVHLVLRIATIAMMISGLIALRKQQDAAEEIELIDDAATK